MKNRKTFFLLAFQIILFQFLVAQTIVKKGYVLTKDGEKVEGLIQLKSKEAYKKGAYFKAYDTPQFKQYQSSELLEFSVPKQFIYKSLSHLSIGQSEEFARMVAKDEDYAYFETIEKRPKYYLQKGVTIFEQIPNGFKKINLEQYKKPEFNYYDLPNNDAIDIPTKYGGFTWKGKRKFLYDGQLYELRRTFIPYFEALANKTLEKFYDPLNAKIIRNYSKKVAAEKGQKWQAVDAKPQLQTSILAFFTPLTSIRDEQYVFEFGLMAEFRDNKISPNWSLSIGASKYEEYQFFTNEIRCNEFVGIGEICDFSTNPIFVLGDAFAFHLGTAYHFRAGKNLRPYVLARLNHQRIYTTLDTSVTDETFGFPVGKVFEARTEVSLRESVGVGVDYYFRKMHQVRVEGLYNRGLEVRIAYGVYFD